MPTCLSSSQCSEAQHSSVLVAHVRPQQGCHQPCLTCVPAGRLPRRQLLDRFNQHTKHCKACRTAYERATAARKIAGVLALLVGSAALGVLALTAAGAAVVTPAASTGAAGAGVAMGWGSGAAMAVLAALMGGAYAALGRLLQSFLFIDFDNHHVGKRPGH